MENLIIIGSGCAGLTAAIYAARANLNPLVIEGKQPGGQLTTTSDIENFPGFPNGIGGFDLTMNMRAQAEKFGAKFVNDEILSVNFDNKDKVITGVSSKYSSKSVIIATGASPRMMNIPGEMKFYGGKGVSVCATCDGAFYRNKPVVVLGGGDTACEEALFLARFCSRVYLVHRRDELRASKVMSDRVKSHEKIEILWNAVAQEVLGVDKVSGVNVENILSGDVTKIECSAMFLAIGHIPNTKVFANVLPMDEQGYFINQEYSLVDTVFPGVFVAGDCADKHFRQAITASGMGCMAAISSERYLATCD